MEVFALCLSGFCLGALIAVWSELKFCRDDLKSSSKNLQEIANRFTTEHNSMANKIISLNDQVNNIKISSMQNITKGFK
jgi:hypothetical protein